VQIVVVPQKVFHGISEIECLGHPVSGGLAEPEAAGFAFQEFFHFPGQRLGIIGRDEHRGGGFGRKDLGGDADRRGDDRQARGGGFEQNTSQGFLASGMDQEGIIPACSFFLSDSFSTRENACGASCTPRNRRQPQQLQARGAGHG
jgi:hypothetical protein